MTMPVVVGWKCIINDPYVLSIIAKGYRHRFTGPPLLSRPHGKYDLPGWVPEGSGNARANIPDALEERDIGGTPRFSRILFKLFLVRKASGGWCLVIDLTQLNVHIYAPHFRMHTISSVLSTVEKGDYVFKIDLQDAYFHVLIHPDSKKYLGFALV